MEENNKKVIAAMKKFEQVYFIVDSRIQASLYEPWQRSFERTGCAVEILNTEKLASSMLRSIKLNWLMQIYRWSRRDEHNSKVQSVLVKIFKPIRIWVLNRINQQLESKIKKKHALVFVFKGLDVKPTMLNKLKQKKNLLVVLNGDSFFNMKSSNQSILESAQIYDAVITWSDLLDNELKLKLCLTNTIQLPFSCEEVSNPAKPSWFQLDLSRSLVFVGVWDKEREEEIAKIEYDNIVVFGPYWDRRNSSFPANINVFSFRLEPEEIAFIYENSAACLNLMRPQNADSHNMKTFEIPAANGTMILPRTLFHMKVFKDAQSVYFYDQCSDIGEIMKKVVLDDPGSRKNAADKTKKMVLDMHSYDNRLSDLLNYLKEK